MRSATAVLIVAKKRALDSREHRAALAPYMWQSSNEPNTEII